MILAKINVEKEEAVKQEWCMSFIPLYERALQKLTEEGEKSEMSFKSPTSYREKHQALMYRFLTVDVGKRISTQEALELVQGWQELLKKEDAE